MNNLKFFFTSLVLFSSTFLSIGQSVKLYDETADPQASIQNAIDLAAKQGKHVFVQAGGNWCSWCIRFDKFSKENAQIDSIFNASYQIVHLNYSKENKNEKTFAQYGFPQRFGFPVFLILDSTGKLIHTQNSEYLEDNKGSYDAIKVFNFLKAWTPQSIDPQTYLNKK
jgi:thioredoxin-related protein